MPQHVKLLGLFIANAKLAMFAIGEMARVEALDQVTFASSEVRDQVTTEYYQHISEQNKAMAEAAKQTIERLKAMPWDERAETVAQLGLDLLVFHGAGKFAGAALAKFIALSTEFKAIAEAERIAVAAGKASAPITELGQQVAVVGKLTVQEGPEVAGKVIEIIKDNPALLAEGKTVAQVVQEVAKDVRSKIGKTGSLVIEQSGKFSASEIRSAEYMRDLGNDVILRTPSGTRAGGCTSDLLVNGVNYDVYTPITNNPSRIISAIAAKKTQAVGIVLDLSQTTVTAEQMGDIMARLNGKGVATIKEVIVLKY